jgi:BirA family biotin operon repressor/biotin-[acetyl-CoA-carboxylase] ligase
MQSDRGWKNIIELEEVHSTNQYLHDLTVCQDVEHGTLVTAGFQSAGKGHGEATWASESGKNLLVSVYLKEPCIPVEKQFYLSKITSLAIRDVLKSICPDTVIKWPNDIFIRNKKIGGILIENTIVGRKLMSAIVGIGLNVNQEHFPAFIPPATSILLETGEPEEISGLLNLLVNALKERYGQLCQEEYDKINREYLGNLYKYKEESKYKAEKHIFLATITGVKESGELELKTGEGTVKTYSFKEVQYIH